MGFEEAYLQESDEELIRAALSGGHPFLEGITLEALLEKDWMPLATPEDWRPYAKGGFRTPSGKAQFCSQTWEQAGLDPLPAHTEPPPGDREQFPLLLISGKALHFLNSGYANMERHRKAEGPPFFEIHIDDAQRAGLEDGRPAILYNSRGEVQAACRISTRVRPGVVWMSSGLWPSLSPGGSAVNALTSDELSDWGGGANFYDTYVAARPT